MLVAIVVRRRYGWDSYSDGDFCYYYRVRVSVINYNYGGEWMSVLGLVSGGGDRLSL